MVMAWVDMKMASGMIASTGSGRRFSMAVATQVAAITNWEKHVLYRFGRGQIARKSRIVVGTLVAGGADQPSKIYRTCGFLRASDGISAGSAFGRDRQRNLSSGKTHAYVPAVGSRVRSSSPPLGAALGIRRDTPSAAPRRIRLMDPFTEPDPAERSAFSLAISILALSFVASLAGVLSYRNKEYGTVTTARGDVVEVAEVFIPDSPSGLLCSRQTARRFERT